MRYIKKPYNFASAGNWPSTSDAWANQPRKQLFTDGQLVAGYGPPNTPAAVEQLNALQSYNSDVHTLAAHAALQTWRHATIPQPGGPTTHTELVGLRVIRAYDTNGDRQRLPVAFGLNSGDGNKTYQARSADGSLFETSAILTGLNYTTPLNSASGQPGEMFLLQATPEIAYSIDHGQNWAQAILTVGGVQAAALHYSAGFGKYFLFDLTGNIYYGSTFLGITQLAAAGIGAIVVNGSEFADNGAGACVFLRKQSSGVPQLYYFNGTTWILAQSLTGASASLTYNAAQGLFVALDDQGVAYVSASGNTWTSLTTGATPAHGFATGRGTMASAGPAVAKMWGMIMSSGIRIDGVAYSFDLGATWNTSVVTCTAGTVQLRGFNNRLYLLGNSDLWTSGALGSPDVEI